MTLDENHIDIRNDALKEGHNNAMSKLKEEMEKRIIKIRVIMNLAKENINPSLNNNDYQVWVKHTSKQNKTIPFRKHIINKATMKIENELDDLVRELGRIDHKEDKDD